MAKKKVTAKKVSKVTKPKKTARFDLVLEFNGETHKFKTDDLGGVVLNLELKKPVVTGLKATVTDTKTKKVATRNWAMAGRARRLFGNDMHAAVFEKSLKTLLGL